MVPASAAIAEPRRLERRRPWRLVPLVPPPSLAARLLAGRRSRREASLQPDEGEGMMAQQTPQADHAGQSDEQQEQPQQNQKAARSREALRALRAFWAKLNHDWVFNLAAMLAYNLLMSIVPILAMLLSFFGLFLDGLAPGAEQQFISQVGAAVPGGQDFIEPALDRLAASSGVLAALTILLSIWFGSRLFVAIEHCFTIIYRLPPRGFARQNLIALGMMIIFAALMPVLLAVSAAPSFLTTHLVDKVLGNALASRIWLVVATGCAGLVIASALFLVIYLIIPNQPPRFKDAWKGALIAGALLEVYIIAFPFYATLFLKADSYGSTVGFAVLVLVFFYYFGVILLLGAEINAFWAGQRQTAGALPRFYSSSHSSAGGRGGRNRRGVNGPDAPPPVGGCPGSG